MPSEGEHLISNISGIDHHDEMVARLRVETREFRNRSAMDICCGVGGVVMLVR